jgi:hypothetical protein
MSFLFKFCFEGMEESGSLNLDFELEKRKDSFLKVSRMFKSLNKI